MRGSGSRTVLAAPTELSRIGLGDEKTPGRAGDLMFLTGVVLASVLTYIARLGFYSDDWAFLAVMRHAQDQSLSGLADALWDFHPNMKMRPTQVAFQALLYWTFDLEPIGYHVVNAVMVAAMITLLYLILRELGVPRVIAVAIPLVYALIPSYSTDRFWFAAFGYTLSMALALGSIYSDLVALRGSRSMLAWKIVSVSLLAIACFGYEIVIPMLILSPAFTWFRMRREREWTRRLHGVAAGVYLISPYAVLALAIAYKARFAGALGLVDRLFHVVRLAVGAVTTHLGSFGFGLPYAAWWSTGELSVAGILLGMVVGVIAFLYLMRVLRSENRFADARTWVRVATAGAGMLGLGYAIFVTTARVGFSSTGPSNRTALAAAMGAAAILVAGAGLLASRASSDSGRRVLFAVVVAGLCSMGSFVIGALGEHWAASWDRQTAVLGDIRAALPNLQSGTTVLLDGVCPYDGPAVVFESNWDLAGAMQIAYGDPTLSADVTTSTMSLRSEGIETTVYGGSAAFHPYGANLLVYDHVTGGVRDLESEKAAREYFEREHAAGSIRCPAGVPGYGELLLPGDRLLRALEARIRPWW